MPVSGGGPSTRHFLPNAAEAAAAEDALRARIANAAPTKGPLPPPAPLPPELLDPGQEPLEALTQGPATVVPPQSALAQAAERFKGIVGLSGATQRHKTAVPQPTPAPAPEPEVELAVSEEQTLHLHGAIILSPESGVTVVLTSPALGNTEVTGQGASLSEALGIAAGELEAKLEVPRCPTCHRPLEQD